MKIAAITQDGKTISKHFGRAPYYLVATVEDGKIVDRELREKTGHAQFAEHESGHAHDHEHGHGMGVASHSKHLMMSDVVSDCEAVLCAGMGMGAYQSLKARGITPVLTGISDIEEAVKAYSDGTIEDRLDLLH